MTSRGGTCQRLTRVLVAGVLLLGAVVLTASGSSAAPEPRDDTLSGTQPNVVVIVTDDQTADSLPYMPYMRGELEAGNYINFSQAEVNNSLCCPSRATILTGQVDTRTGVTNNSEGSNLDPAETFGPALHDVGYRTGIFGKLLNGYNADSGMWPGWDDFQPIVSRNIYAQYDYEVINNGAIETYGAEPEDYAVDVLTQKSLDFIDETPAGRPLLLYVAPTSTHTPYVAAPRHDGTYAREPITLPPNFAEADVSDKPAWVQDLALPGRGGAVNVRREQYEAALGVDDMVRSIDERLTSTGRMEDTVFVFISDNGLSVGSNRWGSKTCELRGCNAIPLVIRYPGQEGRTDTRLASNVDIAPTLADLAGATLPVRPDGISLVAALEDGTGSVRTHSGILQHWPGGDQDGRYATATYPIPGFYGIRTERWRYVEVTNLAAPGDTEYELYDQLNDPGEMENVADDPGLADTRAELRAEMYDLIRATGETPGTPQGSWQPLGTYDQPNFLLRNSNTGGPADINFLYGQDGDVALTCDWDGDGIDSPAVFRDGVFYLRNGNSAGTADREVTFGLPTDIPICGDWNGNGVDTIGVFRDGVFYLRNVNVSGPSDVRATYGLRGDLPVAGDWNGDRADTIGVLRDQTWYLSNSNESPVTAYRFAFGLDGDQPLAGDWNGNRKDTVAVRRGAMNYLTNSLKAGPSDLSFGYGTASDRGLAGNWDGLGGDTVGVVRG